MQRAAPISEASDGRCPSGPHRSPPTKEPSSRINTERSSAGETPKWRVAADGPRPVPAETGANPRPLEGHRENTQACIVARPDPQIERALLCRHDQTGRIMNAETRVLTQESSSRRTLPMNDRGETATEPAVRSEQHSYSTWAARSSLDSPKLCAGYEGVDLRRRKGPRQSTARTDRDCPNRSTQGLRSVLTLVP
jgi:hypothetical protein